MWVGGSSDGALGGQTAAQERLDTNVEAAGTRAQCHMLFPKPGIVHWCVGRTPWSARVPLDPLSRDQADGGVGRGPGVRPTAKTVTCIGL